MEKKLDFICNGEINYERVPKTFQIMGGIEWIDSFYSDRYSITIYNSIFDMTQRLNITAEGKVCCVMESVAGKYYPSNHLYQLPRKLNKYFWDNKYNYPCNLPTCWHYENPGANRLPLIKEGEIAFAINKRSDYDLGRGICSNHYLVLDIYKTSIKEGIEQLFQWASDCPFEIELLKEKIHYQKEWLIEGNKQMVEEFQKEIDEINERISKLKIVFPKKEIQNIENSTPKTRAPRAPKIEEEKEEEIAED